MADNIDKEHLDNPQNTQSENFSDEITPTIDTETITQNKETENMEVHKHPHHVTHKKKWGEYLLEGFMIFIAVTLGFFAESYHVHLVNKEIEQRNVESFITSIQKDSTNIVVAIKYCQNTILWTDSLSRIPGDFTDTLFQKQFFHYALKLIYLDDFIPDESGFLQMQSSGTLRLLKQQSITDSILKYQRQNQTIKMQQAVVNRFTFLSGDDLNHITDFRAAIKQVPFKLNGSNQDVQNYINHKIAQSFATSIYLRMLKQQLTNVTNLIAFLKSEYNIE